MATFTDLAKSYGCEIKQKSAYKNTAETLNEKFEKYWTSLFKDEKTTDRWVNDWSADCEILIPISERGEKYFLIVILTNRKLYNIIDLHNERKIKNGKTT